MISLTRLPLCWCTILIIILYSVRNIECNINDVDGLENYSVFYGISLLSEGKERNDSQCFSELSQIAEGIRRKDRWALKLLDASGAPETKLFWGNKFWLGSQSLCEAATKIKNLPLSISNRTFFETNETISRFPVDYYAFYSQHNSSMQITTNADFNEFYIHMGLCLPASCKDAEVYSLVEEYFDSNKLSIQRLYDMKIKMVGVKRLKADYSWMNETRFKVFVYCISFIIFWSALATLYDIRRNSKSNKKGQNESSLNQLVFDNSGRLKTDVKKVENSKQCMEIVKKENTFENFLLCFSLYKNASSLFDTNVQGDGEKFKVIFGLRCLLSTIIIITHVAFFRIELTQNVAYSVYNSDQSFFKMYTSATFIVDSFLAIGGFLMGYSFFDMEIKRIENKEPRRNLLQKISLIIFGTFSRFLRLTPTYMVALFFAEFSAKWRQNETFYVIAERSDLACSKYWWRNLLYVGNLFPRLELCMSWSWYLNVDMQLFVISLAIIALASPHIKTGAIAFAILLIGSNVYISYLAYSIGYEWFVDNHKKWFGHIYMSTWLRVGPYVVGLFAGVLLRYWNGKLKMSKTLIAFCWLLCFAIFGILTFSFILNQTTPINHALYVSWSRTIWGLATAWFLLACTSNNGGVLSWILSQKLWIVLSRVSYTVYLIHTIIITNLTSFRESPWEMSQTNAIIVGLGFAVITFIISILFSLLFESPLIGITNIIIRSGKKSIKKQRTNTDESKKVS